MISQISQTPCSTTVQRSCAKKNTLLTKNNLLPTSSLNNQKGISDYFWNNKLIGINAAMDMGLTVGLNAILASSSIEPSTKRCAALCTYLILQANKIWKQSLVSQISPSSSNKIIRWIISPTGTAAAIGLSHWTNNCIFETPMSLLSTYFIGVDALSKMNRGDPSWMFPLYLFNISGAAVSTLDNLGFIRLVDYEGWKKCFEKALPKPTLPHQPTCPNISVLERASAKCFEGEDSFIFLTPSPSPNLLLSPSPAEQERDLELFLFRLEGERSLKRNDHYLERKRFEESHNQSPLSNYERLQKNQDLLLLLSRQNKELLSLEIGIERKIKSKLNKLKLPEDLLQKLGNRLNAERKDRARLQRLVDEQILRKYKDTTDGLDLVKRIETQTLKAEAEMAAKMSALDEEYKKLQEQWEELLNFLGGYSAKNTECPKPDADSLKTLDDFTRLTQTNLNPECPDHAKIILTPTGKVFDEALFEKNGCSYIKPIYRKISLLTAFDKNPDQQEKATLASTNLNLATKTLCDLAKQQTE